MLLIHETEDLSFLRRLVSDEEIRAGLVDDSVSPETGVEAFVPGGSRVLEVLEDSAPVGVFVFRPVNTGTAEMHTIMSRSCRGRKAIAAAKLAMQHMFSSGVDEIVSYAFSDAPSALWFAHQIGFRDGARMPYSHSRKGRRVDLTTLTARRA